MYLMYVDESGDSGFVNSPTRYFVLSGLVVHELRWHAQLEQLIAFRKRMKDAFGLKLREEIHASAFINAPGDLLRIRRHDRLAILRHFLNEITSLPDLNLINVVVDKQGKASTYDVFEMAWKALIQRLDNTISHHNFRGPVNADEMGMLFPDHTDNRKLTQLLRKMRRFNPIPNQSHHGQGSRNLTLSKVVEDPSFRDSEHSYFVQAADLSAFLLYQSMTPNAYMRKNAGQNYFKRLEPVLCKVASSRDPLGVVRL